MHKETAVSAWVFSGIFDLYVGFYLEAFHLSKPRVFYSTMGLEKILKGYILYENANEYENLPESESLEKIDKIARRYSHKYEKMITEIIEPKIGQSISKILETDYLLGPDGSENYKGRDFLQALSKVYMESRYPTAEPISTNFRANDYFNWDILHSSNLIDFIYNISIEVLKNLKGKVNLIPKMERVEGYLGGTDVWRRFKNIFFAETNGNIADFFN